MRTELVADHTIAPDLLTPAGWVLDAGANRLHFSAAMVARGMRVVAMDPQYQGSPPALGALSDSVALSPFALSVGEPRNGVMRCYSNDQANAVDIGSDTEEGGVVAKRTVRCVPIESVMSAFNVTSWDLVKLNIEGGEFAVMAQWPGPIAKQISVSFHDFRGMCPADDYYPRMLQHISQWYMPIQHVSDCRYGRSQPSYWDSLFVLR